MLVGTPVTPAFSDFEVDDLGVVSAKFNANLSELLKDRFQQPIACG